MRAGGQLAAAGTAAGWNTAITLPSGSWNHRPRPSSGSVAMPFSTVTPGISTGSGWMPWATSADPVDIPGVTVENGIATLPRSEEHTSELQSPDHLVSRLLLDKK